MDLGALRLVGECHQSWGSVGAGSDAFERPEPLISNSDLIPDLCFDTGL